MKAGLETASFGAGGVSRNWASRVDRFEIGGITLDRLVARYAEDQRGAFASRTEAGNLGTQVLAHFVLDFDYRAGRMSWLAQPGYEAPPFNRAGVRAMKEGPNDFLVVVVAKDSPGDVAGVRAMDRIVALDGAPAARLSGADFNETVAKREGTVVTFDLMRDGKPVVAKVTLRELLP